MNYIHHYSINNNHKTKYLQYILLKMSQYILLKNVYNIYCDTNQIYICELSAPSCCFCRLLVAGSELNTESKG